MASIRQKGDVWPVRSQRHGGRAVFGVASDARLWPCTAKGCDKRIVTSIA